MVEVNGNNVEGFSHSEVVAAIRSNPNETALLVIDKVTDSYLKRIGRRVTSDLLKYKSVFEMESQNLEEETKEQLQNDEEPNEEEKEDNVKEDASAPLSNSQESDTLPEKLEVESEKVIDNADEKLDTTWEKSESIKDEDSVSNTSNTESSATSTSPVNEKIQREPSVDPSYEIINNVPVQEKPPEIPPESKPLRIGAMKPSKSIPKRKQVKEAKTDWKAKQDLFNNL